MINMKRGTNNCGKNSIKINQKTKDLSQKTRKDSSQKEWAEYIISLTPEIEEVKRKVAKILDLAVIDIPIKITFVPERKNVADYVCHVEGGVIDCELIELCLDIYDIEKTLEFVPDKKKLILYLIAHEYTHFMLFVKEPTLFTFRPRLMTDEKEEQKELYRMGYSIYEVLADYICNRLFPEIHEKVLERMDLDGIGSPYKERHQEILKMKKSEYLKLLKRWTDLVPDKRILDAVKNYTVRLRLGKRSLICEPVNGDR
jgi:hypothetical protein